MINHGVMPELYRRLSIGEIYLNKIYRELDEIDILKKLLFD